MTLNCHSLSLWHPYCTVFFHIYFYTFHQLVTSSPIQVLLAFHPLVLKHLIHFSILLHRQYRQALELTVFTVMCYAKGLSVCLWLPILTATEKAYCLMGNTSPIISYSFFWLVIKIICVITELGKLKKV